MVWLDGGGQIVEAPEDAVGSGEFAAAHDLGGSQRGATTETFVCGRTGLPGLEVRFDAGAAWADDPQIALSWDGVDYRVVTALTEDIREHPVEEFTFDQYDFPELGLPAPLGVVGLDAQTWLVLDQQTVHLAALFDGGNSQVLFRDETLLPEETATWRFLVAPDAETAVAAGILLNAAGPIALDLSGDDPADENNDAGGCACHVATSTGACAPLWLLAVVAVWRWRGNLSGSGAGSGTRWWAGRAVRR